MDAVTKSYRLTEDVHEKIKEIASEIGGSQQQTISKLIECYELQKGKMVLVDKKSDIETFENYSNALTRMYMGALEDNQYATDLARTEFDALLKSKDVTIQDLQNQLTIEQQLKEQSALESEVYSKKITSIEKELSDKENLNKALMDSNEELKSKVENMADSVKQVAILQTQLNEMEQLKSKYADIENRLKQEQDAHKKSISELQQHEINALEQLKQTLEIEQQKAILEIKEKLIDEYNQKYFTLFEQRNVKQTQSTHKPKQKKVTEQKIEPIESENQ